MLLMFLREGLQRFGFLRKLASFIFKLGAFDPQLRLQAALLRFGVRKFIACLEWKGGSEGGSREGRGRFRQ